MTQQATYVPPALDAAAFNCPICRVFAKQDWSFMPLAKATGHLGTVYHVTNGQFKVSSCGSCASPTIWKDGRMVYPKAVFADPPNVDLPPDVRDDYEEARLIADESPRGAAALLRLSIQKLCVHLGQPGKNINDDVKALVAAGLPPKVQEALDLIRVVGNESVHPGTVDVRDNREIVRQLFKSVNFIAQRMITDNREIAEAYGALPSDKRSAITRRDS